jgi:hypothetical protein
MPGFYQAVWMWKIGSMLMNFFWEIGSISMGFWMQMGSAIDLATLLGFSQGPH